jgi:cysteine synthase A
VIGRRTGAKACGLEGFCDGFIPGIYARHGADVDEVVRVWSDESVGELRRLGSRHGLFGGPSSGVHWVVARRLGQRRRELQTVFTVFAAEGEKYVGEHLIDD